MSERGYDTILIYNNINIRIIFYDWGLIRKVLICKGAIPVPHLKGL